MFSKLYLPASVPRQLLKEAAHQNEKGNKSRERETWVPGNQGPNARGWWDLQEESGRWEPGGYLFQMRLTKYRISLDKKDSHFLKGDLENW